MHKRFGDQTMKKFYLCFFSLICIFAFVNCCSALEDNANENTDTVGSICAKPYYRKPMKFIGTLVGFVKILVPIIIICFGVMDLYKAITGSKDEALPKAIKMICIRVLAGVFIFLLPGIVQFVLGLVNEWSGYKNNWCCCTECILTNNCDVNSCSSNSCRDGGF